MIDNFSHWMKEIIPGDWEIRLNYDDIPALEAERVQLWERQAKAADILTIDERRALLGYAPIADGNRISNSTNINNTNNPDTGSQV